MLLFCVMLVHRWMAHSSSSLRVNFNRNRLRQYLEDTSVSIFPIVAHQSVVMILFHIEEYVTCHTCRSPETNLHKETRLFFLQCETCGSRCSVQNIKSGFQAVTGKRAQMRSKAQWPLYSCIVYVSWNILNVEWCDLTSEWRWGDSAVFVCGFKGKCLLKVTQPYMYIGIRITSWSLWLHYLFA